MYLFGVSVIGWLQCGWRLALALSCEGWRVIWKRLPLFAALWILLGILTVMHWLGFLCDEILFRGYRRIRPERPVFILGVPRSGTTFLHRVLATDEQFTTLTTWECLLAPSITERFIWTGVGKIFRPLATVIGQYIQRTLFNRMDSIHIIRMNEPEEDFLLLLFMQACFLFVIPCPHAAHYWKLGRFDDSFPAFYRNAVMKFYYRCLQKHLYFRGEEKRFLSKNPSFTPMMRTLRQTFPDAKFIACVRSPLQTIPSQLSSLRPAFELVGTGRIPEDFQARMISLLHQYYTYIMQFGRNDEVWEVEMSTLKADFLETLTSLYRFIGQPISENFSERLNAFAVGAGRYQSSHEYKLNDFSLSRDWVEKKFSDVWPMTTKKHMEAV